MAGGRPRLRPGDGGARRLIEDAGSDEAAAELAFEAWRGRSRPANEIPASVPVDAAIGSSEGLVVFVASLSVYTNGISFTTEARARGGPGSDDRPVSLVEGMLGKVPVRDRMLLGVELSAHRGLRHGGAPGRAVAGR